jgi:quinol monooxygenase YgiN
MPVTRLQAPTDEIPIRTVCFPRLPVLSCSEERITRTVRFTNSSIRSGKFDMSVVVVVTVKSRPGQANALEEALIQTAVEIQQDDSCELYALHRSTHDPETFLIIEHWSTEEDLAHHATVSKGRSTRVHQFMLGQPTFERLSPIPVEGIRNP